MNPPTDQELIAEAQAARVRSTLTKEEQAHRSILNYLLLVLPDGYLVHHSPNEGKRTLSSGMQMKRSGTLAGWPDLEIVGPGGSTFFIEVKRGKGGVLSEAQQNIKAHCIAHGIPWALCRSIDDAREALFRWHVPTREAVS